MSWLLRQQFGSCLQNCLVRRRSFRFRLSVDFGSPCLQIPFNGGSLIQISLSWSDEKNGLAWSSEQGTQRWWIHRVWAFGFNSGQGWDPKGRVSEMSDSGRNQHDLALYLLIWSKWNEWFLKWILEGGVLRTGPAGNDRHSFLFALCSISKVCDFASEFVLRWEKALENEIPIDGLLLCLWAHHQFNPLELRGLIWTCFEVLD